MRVVAGSELRRKGSLLVHVFHLIGDYGACLCVNMRVTIRERESG